MPRFDTRLPADLHEALRNSAHEKHQSLNAEIVERLRGSYTPKHRALAEREVGGGYASSVKGSAAVEPREASLSVNPRRPVTEKQAPGASRSASACPMYVPHGTKCKSCGKVH